MTQWKKLENRDMHCFACGPKNVHGLNMTFESNSSMVRSQNIVIPEHLRGWSSLAHGGVLTTILDETMSWAAIHLLRRFILTQNINVEFKKPVYINTRLSSTAWIKEKLSSRKVILESELRNEENELCVFSEGKFVLFEPEQFKKLGLVESELLKEMESMFI